MVGLKTKKETKMLDKIGGRKFILALILVAVGTTIEMTTDRGVSASFAGLLGVILAAFGASNVIAKKKNGESIQVGAEAPAASVEVEALSYKLDEIQANQETLMITVANNQKILRAAAINEGLIPRENT
jgi:protein-S-isoprenylcysteine O-methyltransferase Ste14